MQEHASEKTGEPQIAHAGGGLVLCTTNLL
jgi:hypothetical protein